MRKCPATATRTAAAHLDRPEPDATSSPSSSCNCTRPRELPAGHAAIHPRIPNLPMETTRAAEPRVGAAGTPPDRKEKCSAFSPYPGWSHLNYFGLTFFGSRRPERPRRPGNSWDHP